MDKFDEMDKEMYEREGRQERLNELNAVPQARNYLRNRKHPNYRLLYEHEVPAWVHDVPKLKQNDELPLGKRQRKEVRYDDGLTDL